MENKIWHTLDEFPKRDKLIVCISPTEEFYSCYSWGAIQINYIKMWAYVSDLIACTKALDVARSWIDVFSGSKR
ncbi:MAG: hypothetical protein NC548_44475 [Lachnospiraceae bacterium]|nr:hypothetical protein [Lachnospiraceae bacterium]